MQASIRERVAGALGTAIVLGLFGYLLLFGMIVDRRASGDRTVTLLALSPPPHRPRPTPPTRPIRAGKASHPAAPRNLRNNASEVVAPPRAAVAPPPPIVTAPKAGIGMAASSGASDRPGPGEGAGGLGSGTGGGNGNDDGGGIPPRMIRGRLSTSDLPNDLRDDHTPRAVSVRFSVELDGRVGECLVTASSGNAELDALTCRLIQRRFRFRPSRDGDGRPVRSRVEETHSWIFDPAPASPQP